MRQHTTRAAAALVVFALAGLAGCGTKGPLTLPSAAGQGSASAPAGNLSTAPMPGTPVSR